MISQPFHISKISLVNNNLNNKKLIKQHNDKINSFDFKLNDDCYAMLNKNCRTNNKCFDMYLEPKAAGS